MFKVDGEVIESTNIGNNKYELRSNGIYLYSENLKQWSPYARRHLDRHWDRIKTTSKEIENVRSGKSSSKKK